MNTRKKLLHISILSFMVFSLLIIVPKSYAFWSDINLTSTTTETITLGEWNQIFEWDPNETYQTGDVVSYNGTIYEAKNDNPTREPGSPGSRKDWTPQ